MEGTVLSELAPGSDIYIYLDVHMWDIDKVIFKTALLNTVQPLLATAAMSQRSFIFNEVTSWTIFHYDCRQG